MLGRDGVDERQRLVEVRTRMMAPKSRHEAPAILRARQRRELAFDGALDSRGQRWVVGDQDRLRAGVVLGLRQQIGGDPVRHCRSCRR